MGRQSEDENQETDLAQRGDEQIGVREGQER